jgi:two-component system, LuxR family, sensor kinase FixL
MSMTTTKPMRLAIVLNGEEFACPPVILPFSLEGQPPVDIVWFGGVPEAGSASQVEPLTALPGVDFDLILDGDFLTAGLPDLSPEKLERLITGPAAGFLEDMVCRLRELRQKQEINSGIIHSASDAIVTINEDHVIVGYNLGAEKMLGYTRDEALGQDLNIIIPAPYKAEHREYVRRYVATREARLIGKHVRLTAQRRDGSEFPMSISFSVAEIRDNLYFTGIIRDNTENQEMEDRVLQAERLAAVGNTVTHIAHEIKNPLMIIGGFARQLLRLPDFDDKGRQKLTIMAEEVSNLEKLVAEMRDFVRRPPAVRQRGFLAAPLSEALALFQDTFSDNRLKVNRVEETPLPELNFDAGQILQVLINLFKNALEAMPRGGELTITTRVRGGGAELVVADTGEGMPPEVVANIFQPYFTTKAKGTGLGLAICQNILQEHGGSLTAESTPGQGSAFTIRLPLPEPLPA